jgi:2H phosphodiesterase-like protein
MIFSFIKDIFSNNYIAIDIGLDTIDKNGVSFYDLTLKALEKIDDFNVLENNLLKRNNGKYHLTVFSVPEYAKNESVDDIVGSVITEIEFKGIGSITKNDHTTYFVVVDCPFINKLRSIYSFQPKDLHITIGFNNKDLFHERKNVCNVFAL